MQEPSTRKRIGWLVAAHLILVMGTALESFIQANDSLLLLSAALAALPLATLMMVSVWLGMGRARFIWRLITSISAIAYTAIWPTVDSVPMALSKIAYSDLAEEYLNVVCHFCLLVAFCAGMLKLLGRWFELIRVDGPSAELHRAGFRFTVVHALVLMAVAAVILTLLRTIRVNGTGNEEPSVLGWTADDSLGAILVFIITGCATLATLSSSGAKRNIGVVLFVSVLSGAAVAISNGDDQVNWLAFVEDMLFIIVPTIIVRIAVRSAIVRISASSSRERRSNDGNVGVIRVSFFGNKS